MDCDLVFSIHQQLIISNWEISSQTARKMLKSTFVECIKLVIACSTSFPFFHPLLPWSWDTNQQFFCMICAVFRPRNVIFNRLRAAKTMCEILRFFVLFFGWKCWFRSHENEIVFCENSRIMWILNNKNAIWNAVHHNRKQWKKKTASKKYAVQPFFLAVLRLVTVENSQKIIYYDLELFKNEADGLCLS